MIDLSLSVIWLAVVARAFAVSLPLLWTGRALRRRFWALLVLLGIGHLAAWSAWALTTWWVLRRLGPGLRPEDVIDALAVASTPMVLAWVGLFPFLGPIVSRALDVLSVGLLALGLAAHPGVGPAPAIAAALAGAAVRTVALFLLGRPAYAVWQPKAMADGPLAGARPPTGAQPGDHLVYLQGVSAYSPEYIPHRDEVMLRLVAARVPGIVVVSDIFAYDIEGMGLGPRAAFWRWVHHERLRRGGRIRIVGRLINLRNLLLIAVSADRRYGAVYSQGLAFVLQRVLEDHGYRVGSRRRVTLLGYSGGAQLAAGTAAYLARRLDAPVQIVTVGGVIWSDRGFEYLEHIYDLIGSRDWVRRLATIVFPRRWRIAVASPWNRARTEGRITQVTVGPMDHTGRGGYFALEAKLPDGRTFVEATAAAIAAALTAPAGTAGQVPEGWVGPG